MAGKNSAVVTLALGHITSSFVSRASIQASYGRSSFMCDSGVELRVLSQVIYFVVVKSMCFRVDQDPPQAVYVDLVKLANFMIRNRDKIADRS